MTQVTDLQQPKDLTIIKTHYSAFQKTALLTTLRSKLITEIFIAGCLTNLSVYATAMDAARYGIKITLIEDSLGYRKKERHDLAISQLKDTMEARTTTADRVIEDLRNPPEDETSSAEDASESDEEDEYVPPPRDYGTSLLANNAAGMLEVDSEESDGESVMPIVGLPSSLERRKELRAVSETKVDGSSVTAPRRKNRSPVAGQQTAPELSKTRHRPDGAQEKAGNTRTGDQQPGRATTDQYPSTTRSHMKPHESLGISDKPRIQKPISKIRSSAQQPLSKSSTTTIPLRSRKSEPTRAPESLAVPTMTAEELGEARHIPLFGEGKDAESGDSKIFYDVLPEDFAATVFRTLKDEISWQKMHHQQGEVPRLVCCQATIASDGSTPVYRHPSDQTLPTQKWTPTVDRIRIAVEKLTGHPLNHALIQLYRNGTDYISEHSDKTLDIVPGSCIVNVSLGAQRTMRLRTKRGAARGSSAESLARTTYRVAMPHNSMISMSLPTNAQYLHGINADKRPAVELTPAEKAFDGQRISLTFRHIGTFLSADAKHIWGQGAVAKTPKEARPVINGNVEESTRMVNAFGAENTASSINWDAIYGEGFDVLHLKAATPPGE